ncbi:MAG: hypothetical protein IJL02_09495 [Methanobrevibacter sp.]|uniref:hypothetical protein n=1 Tax=Methanobrevibacter sp. TaxID=66852 RepID=UPI0025F74170|nr:hypothetical protein [Methanobrevibacter sp.]MBQ6100074.1 hypothetical protein [Methanobrevibacter sp.]
MGLFDRFKTPDWKNNNYDIRLNAVKELNDQEILKDVAIHDASPFIRTVAMSKINDEKFIIDLAENGFTSQRPSAINALENPEALLRIARNDKDEYCSKKAYARCFKISVEKDSSDYSEIGQEFYKKFPEDIRAISAMLYTAYKEKIPLTGEYMYEYKNAYDKMLLNSSSAMNVIDMELQDWYLDLGNSTYKKL